VVVVVIVAAELVVELVVAAVEQFYGAVCSSFCPWCALCHIILLQN
jgi:hypothetical protein